MSVKLKVKPRLIEGEKILVKNPDTGKYIKAKIESFNNSSVSVRYTEPVDIETYGNQIVKYNQNDTKKLLMNNSANSSIRPQYWTQQNKKIFKNWVDKTFIKYRLTGEPFKKRANGKFELYPYQKFVRDYMQLSSPYRGILLYHGLGSGKTCASVAIAENLKENKKVLIILPTSLKSNFISQGLKKCGSPEYRGPNGDKLIKEKYKFVSLNASNTLQQLTKLGNIDDHVIVVDEAHNLISRIVSGIKGASKQGKEIYKLLLGAKNTKFVFLSGIPIINDPFEAAIMFNILRGYIEILIFYITDVSNNPNKKTNLQRLETNLKEIDEIKYLKINPTNRTIEMTLSVPQYSPDFQNVVNKVINGAQNARVKIKHKTIEMKNLFPSTQDTFDKYFIKNKGTEKETLINENLLQRRLSGLISYYRSEGDKDYPELHETEIINTPMSNYQYGLYQEARQIEKQVERSAASKKKQKQQSKSYFRIHSRMISNFVFPPSIKRYAFIQTKKKNKDKNKNKNKNINKKNNLNEPDEQKMRTKQVEKNLRDLKNGSDMYLTQDNLALYSPKMKIIMEMIEKSEGIVLIYSHFVNVEGLEIMSYILEQNGFSFYSSSKNGQKYAIFSGNETEKEREGLINITNDPQNADGSKIKVLMISSAGAEGLDLKNVRNVYIMEPHWNEARIQQVIGRARRKNSHDDMSPKDRYVKVFRFHSIFTDEQKKQSKEKTTTDEHIYILAKKKERVTQGILDIMKSVAVDCTLNAKDNQLAFPCFRFGEDPDVKKLAYLPRIRDDELYGDASNQSVKKKKNLLLGGIDKNNFVVFVDKKKLYYAINKNKMKPIGDKPRIKKKVYVDINTGDVYDYNTKPKKIGSINNKSQFIQ